MTDPAGISRATPPLAVVGLACRFPDADDPAALLDVVLTGRRSFRRLPSGRFDLAEYYQPDLATSDATYSTRAALIEGWQFEHRAFGVDESSYAAADPAHWLALETAARALSAAGLPAGTGLNRDRTGVIIGNTLAGDTSRANALRVRWPYVRRVLADALSDAEIPASQAAPVLRQAEKGYLGPFPPMGPLSLAGSLPGTIATAISSYFGFRGGSHAVDSACSSALQAVASACTALVAGDLDAAVAGGVDLSLDPLELIGLAKAGLLATGDVRLYDEHPTGYLPGEGCGVVVLMRAADARAANLQVYAEILGWGVSSGAQRSETTSHASSQLLAMKRAYERSAVDPADIHFIEGNGASSRLTDEAELTALNSIRAGAKHPAALGSVKANIGHAQAAAGAAGLIKAVLAVSTGVVPPTTGAQSPHQLITEGDGNLVLPRVAQDWEPGARLAAVSATGIGGSNVHVVLRHEPAARAKQDRRQRSPLLGKSAKSQPASAESQLTGAPAATPFLVHAPSRQALEKVLSRIADIADWLSDAEMQDLACSLGRDPEKQGQVRVAIVAIRQEQLAMLAREAVTMLPYLSDGLMTLRPGIFASDNADGRVTLLLSADRAGAAQPEASPTALSPAVTRSLATLRWLDSLEVSANAAVGHGVGALAGLAWAGALGEAEVLEIAHLRAQFLLKSAERQSPATQTPGPGASPEAGVSASADPAELSAAIAQRFRFGPPRRRLISTLTGSEVESVTDAIDLICRGFGGADRVAEAIKVGATGATLLLETGPGHALVSAAADVTNRPAISLNSGLADPASVARAAAALFAAGALGEPKPLFAGRPARPLDIWREHVFLTSPCAPARGALNDALAAAAHGADADEAPVASVSAAAAPAASATVGGAHSPAPAPSRSPALTPSRFGADESRIAGAGPDQSFRVPAPALPADDSVDDIAANHVPDDRARGAEDVPVASELEPGPATAAQMSGPAAVGRAQAPSSQATSSQAASSEAAATADDGISGLRGEFERRLPAHPLIAAAAGQPEASAESAPETPATETPAAVQDVAAEPATTELAAVEDGAAAPTAAEPAAEEAAAQEPTAAADVAAEPAPAELATAEPAAAEPAAAGTAEPASTEPAAAEPAAAGTAEPATTEPTATPPATAHNPAQPATTKPTATPPATAHTTAQPATPEPAAAEPEPAELATAEPAAAGAAEPAGTAEPATTEPTATPPATAHTTAVDPAFAAGECASSAAIGAENAHPSRSSSAAGAEQTGAPGSTAAQDATAHGGGRQPGEHDVAGDVIAVPSSTAITPEAGLGPWMRCFAAGLRSVRRPPTHSAPRPWRTYAAARGSILSSLSGLFAADPTAGRTLAVVEDPSDERSCAAAIQAATDAITTGELVVVTNSAGFTGFFASLHAEHPSIGITILRMQDAAVSTDLVMQLATTQRGVFRELVLGPADTVSEPVLTAVDLPGGGDVALSAEDVIMITRATKGAGLALAQVAACCGAGVVVIGRAGEHDDSELIAGFEDLRSAGARVGYEIIDLDDPAAVTAAIERIEDRLGPVTAIAHAAGLDDPVPVHLIAEAQATAHVSDEAEVLDLLAGSVRDRQLRLIISVGTVASRYGLAGASLHALSSAALADRAEELAADSADCQLLHLDLAAWSDTGLGERTELAEELAAAGTDVLDLGVASRLLLKVMSTPGVPRNLAIHGRVGGLPASPAPVITHAELTAAGLGDGAAFLREVNMNYPGAELVCSAGLSLASDPYLADYRIDGMPVLPPVLALEALAQTASVLAGQPLRRLTKVTLESPVLIPTSRDAALRVYALRDGDTIVAALRCADSSYQVDHARAEFSCAAEQDEMPQAGIPADPLGRQLGTGPSGLVDGAELYGSICFQSGRFRRIALLPEVTARSGRALARGGDEQPWFTADSPFAKASFLLGSPGLNDAPLQVVQACVPHRRVRAASCESVQLSDPSSVGPVEIRATAEVAPARPGEARVPSQAVVPGQVGPPAREMAQDGMTAQQTAILDAAELRPMTRRSRRGRRRHQPADAAGSAAVRMSAADAAAANGADEGDGRAADGRAADGRAAEGRVTAQGRASANGLTTADSPANPDSPAAADGPASGAATRGQLTAPSEPASVATRQQARVPARQVWNVEAVDADGQVLAAWRGIRLRDSGPLPRNSAWPPMLLSVFLERRAADLGLDDGLRVTVRCGHPDGPLPKLLTTVPQPAAPADGQLPAEGRHAGPERRTVNTATAAGTGALAGFSVMLRAPVPVACGWVAVELAHRHHEPAAGMTAAYAELRAELTEPPSMLAARLAAVGAALKMAGLAADRAAGRQVTVTRTTNDGWVLFAVERALVACAVVELSGVGAPVAIAMLTKQYAHARGAARDAAARDGARLAAR
ncbi:MAG TPA: SDR family NAD(P)-dependent oxidoreductase [Streptosporangiaceae bacterium]|nr:SDR family NAD(P)-dependent oxidoreductase [Streptosporangiaceae bacterium]